LGSFLVILHNKHVITCYYPVNGYMKANIVLDWDTHAKSNSQFART